MNYAMVSHDPATGRITVHGLPTLAVIEPCVNDKGERMWNTEVTIRLPDGSILIDEDPGHAIMEVLGLYAEDGDTPRWLRLATGMPVPHRPETVIVKPSRASFPQPKPWNLPG